MTTGGACVPPGRLSVIQASIRSHQSYSQSHLGVLIGRRAARWPAGTRHHGP